MADTNKIKMQIKRFIADGRGEDAYEFAEAVRDELTDGEVNELERWIALHAYENFRSQYDEKANRGKWLTIAAYSDEDETLRDVFPELPKKLQDFLRHQARRGRAKNMH